MIIIWDLHLKFSQYELILNPHISPCFLQQGLGEVAEVGSNTKFSIGQPVMYISYGAFSEYKVGQISHFMYKTLLLLH